MPRPTVRSTVDRSWPQVGRQVDALLQREVLADVCGTFLDAAGTALSMPLTRQIIAIDAERLHAVRDVICVAYGRGTAAAVRTALRASYVTTLVTTAAFAQELLRPTEG